MNGDKKSLGELIHTMNGAKVDSNVGMLILWLNQNCSHSLSILAIILTAVDRLSSVSNMAPSSFNQYWRHTGRQLAGVH